MEQSHLEVHLMSYNIGNIRSWKYTQREVDFILYNLSLEDQQVILPNDLDFLDRYIDLKSKNRRDVTQKIYFKPKYCLVKYDLFKWYKDDLRRGLWFYAYMYIYHKEINLNLKCHGDFLKDLLYSFDCSYKLDKVISENYVDKDYYLYTKNFAIRRASHLYIRYRTKTKYLHWLDPRNQKQIDWAIDYLEERRLLIQPFNFILTSNVDLYMQICSSIDAIDLHSEYNIKAESQKKVDYINDFQDKNDESIIQENPFASASKFLECDGSIISSLVIPELDKSIDENKSYNRSVEQSGTDQDITKEEHTHTRYNPFHEGFEPTEYKKKLLKRMRTAWNKKVFDSKEHVRPDKQVKLPHGYNKKLTKIAEAYDENTLDCLKQILDKEYDDVILGK